MPEFGKVTSITERNVGTTLALAASATQGTITVDDVAKLDWPAGGLRIGTEQFIYTVDVAPDESVLVIDLDEDEEGSDEEGTITLTSGVLNNGYDVDEPVLQFPVTTERVATVLLPDQMEELVLRVPRGLWDRLPANIRLRDGAADTVALENEGGQWVITDVVDEDPSVDGSFLNVLTLPTSVTKNAGTGTDNTGFFAEAWTAPGNLTGPADNTYAHAVGTGITDPPTPGNTGFKFTTVAYQDVSVGTVNWNVMELATGPSDGIGAATNTVNSANTRYLGAIWFNFNVPVGATINGISVVIVRGKVPPKTVTDNSVRLLKAQVPVGSDYAIDLHWPDDLTGIQYGGATDLWGTAWTPADINDVGFGVALSADLSNGAAAEVDSFRVKVNYTIPATAARSSTHFLMATNFGFAIPDEAAITGITVAVERHASADSGDNYAIDNQVRLVTDTGDVSSDHGARAHWPTSDTTITYGGDLWGLEWLPEQVNDPAFGVWISADVNNGVTASVDSVAVTVSYVTVGDAV